MCRGCMGGGDTPTFSRQIGLVQENKVGRRESRMCRGCLVFFSFFGCVFSSLLRCESKYSRIILVVYIIRGYRGQINENLLSKKS